MDHSSLPTAHEPSSAHPSFGGSPATLSTRLKQASDTLGMAHLTLDQFQIVGPRLSKPEQAQVHALLADAQSLVTTLVRESRSAGRSDLDATLTHVSNTVNLAMALLAAKDLEGAREAMRQAQSPLLAAVQVAVVSEEVAAQNLAAAASTFPMPFFRPAPDMPRDAGSVSWPAVASMVGIAILMALLVAVFGGPKKADARALDGKPIQAVKVAPSKASPKPKCSPLYRVDLTVRTTAKSTADGRYHAAVWVQADNRRPVRDEHGVWQYARPLKVGFGVSDSKRVPVSGCLDPRRVDGVDGTPIYLILNDPVDDDRDAQGRIRRGSILVKFVEGAGWKQVSK